MKRRDFITKSISAGVVAGTSIPLLSQQAKANSMEKEMEQITADPLAEISKTSARKPTRKMKVGLFSRQEFVISASDVKLRLLQDDGARLSVTGLDAYGRRLFSAKNDTLGNLLMVCVRNHALAGKYPLSTFQVERARMEGGKFSCDLIGDTLPLTLTIGIRPAGHTLEFSAQACWTDDSNATLDIIFPFFVNIGLPGAKYIMPRLSGAIYPGIEEYNVAANYAGHLSAPFHMIQANDMGMLVLDKSRAEFQVVPGQLMRRAFFNANDIACLDDMVKSQYFSVKKTDPTGVHFNGIIHTCDMRAQTEAQKYMEADIENMGDSRLGQGSAGSMWFGDYKDLGPIDVYVYRGNWKIGADYARKARAHVPMYEAPDWGKYVTFLDEDRGDSLVRRGESYYDLPKIMAAKRSNGSDLFIFVGFHEGVRQNSPMVFHFINRGDYQIPAEPMGGFQAVKRGIEALHRQGGHVICYVESLIMWKLSRIGLEKGKKWAIMEADGSYCEHYKGFWHMCPSCDEWTDYFAETCAALVRDWHVDGFFIDSLCATFAHDCHNPEHNHPHPYTWNWGMRRLLRKVREAINQVNPNSFLLIEGVSDLAREYCNTFMSHTNPWLGNTFTLPILRYVYPKINVHESSGGLVHNVIFSFVNGCMIRYARNRDESSTEIYRTARTYHDMYPELSMCQISMYDAQVSETVISQLFECGDCRILTLGNMDANKISASVKLPFGAGALFDRVTGKYVEMTENACKVEMPGYGISVFDVLP